MNLPTESATRLAIARITVAAVWLISGDVQSAASFASLPIAMRAAPRGLAWTLNTIPVTPLLGELSHIVVVCASLAGLLGFYSRASFAIIAVIGTYLLYIPQLAGTVLHTHHLVWLAAILAISPCGDALSIDSRSFRPTSSRSVAYAFPVRVMWVMIACVFFFPGVWKLIHGGTAWFTSDNFRNLVGWKELQSGRPPLFDVVVHPWLCNALAIAAVGFELSFPLLLVFRRTRVVALGLALLFHAGTAALLHIHFMPLWLCYTVFLDWDRILAPFAQSESPQPPQKVSPLTTAVAGALMLAVASAGALRVVDGWPFACYPPFDEPTPRTMPALLVEVDVAGGHLRVLPLPRDSREWALSWRTLGLYGQRPTERGYEAYWQHVRASPELRGMFDQVRSVRFYRAQIDVTTKRAVHTTQIYSRQILRDSEQGRQPPH